MADFCSGYNDLTSALASGYHGFINGALAFGRGAINLARSAGRLGADWGVCANQRSPFDRRAMFEHDGCDFFEEAPEGWRAP